MREPRACGLAAALVAVLGLAVPAVAQNATGMGGHVALGYSHLFIKDSPGGSLGVAAGIDYPLVGNVRIGTDVGFALLGSRTIHTDVEVANLDYSLFEASLRAILHPHGLGPIGRIAIGPSVMSARADLSASGGGLAFTGQAIEEVAPGMALDVTLLKSSSHSPVVAGLDLGVHTAFLKAETWTITSLMLAIHY